MLITILEGHVTSEKWEKLEAMYRRGIKQLPPQLIQSFLLQSKHDPNLWQIISLWRSQEEYDEAVKHEHISVCVEMFRSVGVEPHRHVLDVMSHHMHVWGNPETPSHIHHEG